MSFKDFKINISYKSMGDESISDIINPLLQQTKIYKRSVGFFSSSVLDFIGDGIKGLAKNGGKIYLATCPRLSKEDIDAIYAGYIDREKVENTFISEFEQELEKVEIANLEILYELIKNSVLDVKIVITKTGIYHDKLALLEDYDGNIVAFVGSANESGPGYHNNYEKIRVYKSWTDTDGRIQDEFEEFDSIWEESNDFLIVYDFMKAIEQKVLEVAERKRKAGSGEGKKIELHDYQKIAIQKWKENNYHGFFEMATGTGKTFTSIFGLKQLMEEIKTGLIVICAPYKHLVSQWIDDLVKIFPNNDIVHVSSDNPKWTSDFKKAIISQKYGASKFSIIVSTIKSFSMNNFENTFMDILSQFNGNKILVVDEAHRFVNKINDDLKLMFNYMLGLSATPYSGNSVESGNRLIDFFGGKVFEYSLEEAIKNKYLVEYNYYPIFVRATQEEEERFNYYSQRMSKCFKNNVLVVSKSDFNNIRNARLRVIANSYEKRIYILDIIRDNIKEFDHFIVYAGDGKIADDSGDIRFIQFVKDNLDLLGYRIAQFTCDENLNERMERIENFNSGFIDTLVAIKCLDEGVNIPSIKSALIISSSDDPKEFIQRRGRILRTYTNSQGEKKKYANIYDVIVLPSIEVPKFAKIELRRFKEYNRLALNKEENLIKLKQLCSDYDLDIDELNFAAYDDNLGDDNDGDE